MRWWWASLAVQWFRIHLPMQGPWIHSLVREDSHAERQLSPCTQITEPTHHNHWSLHTVEHPCSLTREANTMRSLCTATKSSVCSSQLEKAHVRSQRPSAVKAKHWCFMQGRNLTLPTSKVIAICLQTICWTFCLSLSDMKYHPIIYIWSYVSMIYMYHTHTVTCIYTHIYKYR